MKGATRSARRTIFGSTSLTHRCTCMTCKPRSCNLLGFDHEKLTYTLSGADFRLTDIHGHVRSELWVGVAENVRF